jgi:hypothetical protein
MSNQLDFTAWSCPIPLRHHPTIIMGHGGGGKLSAELVEHRLLGLIALQLVVVGELLEAEVAAIPQEDQVALEAVEI